MEWQLHALIALATCMADALTCSLSDSCLRPQAVACRRSSCDHANTELAISSDAFASRRVVFIAPCCLLQVLSVQTALSIQSHPDKKLAERLHAENPAVSDISAASACNLHDRASCVAPRDV